jgi:serine/threonine-protein kinase
MSVTQNKRVCLTCGSKFDDTVETCPQDGSILKALANDPLVGKVFAGKYEILGVLGSGGMSSVYRARHLLLRKLCALKLLHSQHSSKPERVMRFQQEARAIAALDHPNIISVQEFSISDSGEAFLEMDLLEGVSLQEVIDSDGHMNVDEFAHVFRQVLGALEHAHAQGIIHRDLKPSNIMLVGNRPEAVVKVVDFGIAKVLADQESGEQKLTKTGELFGSPIYMSPEQCGGEPIDKRSDIYSLGCVMFECLCGKPPYKGDSVFKTLKLHIAAPQPSMGDVNPSVVVPDAFEELVQTAMQKDPGRRFQTVDEFKQGLEKAVRFSAGSPLPGRMRRGLAKMLAFNRDMSLASHVKRVVAMIIFYTVIAACFVAVVAPEDLNHFLSLVIWKQHDNAGYDCMKRARDMKPGEARALQYKIGLDQFQKAQAEAEKYSARDYAFSRWMRYTVYQHRAQLYMEMGDNDRATTEVMKANQLYMEPILSPQQH